MSLSEDYMSDDRHPIDIVETIAEDRFLVLHQGRVMADLRLSHLSSQAPLRRASPRHRLRPKVQGTPPMPISARDIENLIRAAFPQARVRVDGDDGQPEANEAMRLLVAVTDLIASHN